MSFLLLCLRWIGVVPFVIPPVDRGSYFCYASGGVVFGLIDAVLSQSVWFFFYRRWLVVVSVFLFRSSLARRSQCGSRLVVNGLL